MWPVWQPVYLRRPFLSHQATPARRLLVPVRGVDVVRAGVRVLAVDDGLAQAVHVRGEDALREGQPLRHEGGDHHLARGC